MIDFATELGIQSFVLRHFKTKEELAVKVKETGLNRIELFGGHFDRDNPSSLTKVAEYLGSQGITVTGVGTERLTDDESQSRNVFDLGKAAGVSTLVIDFPIAGVPGCFPVAEKLAEEYGFNLAIHIHGGHHWLSNAPALDWIFGQTGPRVGLCLDTGWAIDGKQDPVALAEKYGDRLYGVHFKDFIYDRVRKPVDVIIGDGLLDLPAFLSALKDLDYSGPVSFEYEGEPENPVPAVRKCVEAVQKAAGV